MIATLAPTFPVISSLEAGLRADCARLIEFEAELTRALEESQELANVRGEPSDWDTGCRHHWDHVQVVLHRIHPLVAEMHDAVISSQRQVASKAWDELQYQETVLANALCGLREQSAHLNEAAAMDWKRLVLTIESHRKAVQAGIQGLDIRLQSWAAHSPLVAVVETPDNAKEPDTSPRPDAEGMDPATYTQDFDQAAMEIEVEQHQEMGLLDSVKALFMWVETPGERVRKKIPMPSETTHLLSSQPKPVFT